MNKKKFFLSMLVTILVVVVIGGGLATANFLFGTSLSDEISRYLDKTTTDKVNVLLMGLDEDKIRADVIMVVSVDPKENTVNVLSIPRDTRVQYSESKYDKINHAMGYKNPEETIIRLVKQVTGMPIHYYCEVDFAGFRNVIDILGGVEFDVPQDMDYTDPAQGLEIHLRAGRQLLGGEQAMQLVRYRKGYAMQDIRRTEVQQEFLRALARRCLSPQNIGRLPELLSIMRQSVTTDLSLGNFLYFAQALHTCGVSELYCCTLAGEGVTVNGVSYYPLYEGRLLETVNAHLNPYDAPRTSADVRVITPQRVGMYQKPETKQKQTPPEKAPARTEIQPMPNDPALWS